MIVLRNKLYTADLNYATAYATNPNHSAQFTQQGARVPGKISSGVKQGLEFASNTATGAKRLGTTNQRLMRQLEARVRVNPSQVGFLAAGFNPLTPGSEPVAALGGWATDKAKDKINKTVSNLPKTSRVNKAIRNIQAGVIKRDRRILSNVNADFANRDAVKAYMKEHGVSKKEAVAALKESGTFLPKRHGKLVGKFVNMVKKRAR